LAAPPLPADKGPLAGVPAGQILVIHIPDAARVLAEADAVLTAAQIEMSRNPLRQQLESWKLSQPLSAGSSVTICIGPPARLGGEPLRAALVTKLDLVKVLGDLAANADGVYARPEAPPVMVLKDGALAIGDAESLAALAHVARGVTISSAESEALADADVLIRFDPALALSRNEPQYEAARSLLAGAVARMRREEDETSAGAKVAALERRLKAAAELWARAHELSGVTAGLVVNRRAVDARVCVSAMPGSALARGLSGHPALAGELNPPLPREKFAALGYAAFDATNLVAFLQWLTDAAVEAAVAFDGEKFGLGPAESGSFHSLFHDLPTVLGGRAAFLVPIRAASEPVVQADGLVELKGPDRGTAWQNQVPGTLGALVFLANVGEKMRAGPGEKGGILGSKFSLKSSFDPGWPESALTIDHWHLAVLGLPAAKPVPAPAGGSGLIVPPPEGLLLRTLAGPSGVDLWNTSSGASGYFSVAPTAARVPGLISRQASPQFGQAGDDELTVEALRHVLRRANAVVMFSPSELMQLLSRSMVQGYIVAGRQSREIPIINSRALSVLSLRGESGALTARLYLPVVELAPLVSDWQTLQLLTTPAEEAETNTPLP
jgi:hypothetical protein